MGSSMAVRVATGGALALIGLVVVKFILGMLGVAIGFTMFLLFKVLPLLLIVGIVVWLLKKASTSGSAA